MHDSARWARYDDSQLALIANGHNILAREHWLGGEYGLAHYHRGLHVSAVVEQNLRDMTNKLAFEDQLSLDEDS